MGSEKHNSRPPIYREVLAIVILVVAMLLGAFALALTGMLLVI